jgi:capsular polysaccharide biosynthesis protein
MPRLGPTLFSRVAKGTPTLDLSDFLRLLRARWLAVCCFGALGAALGLVWAVAHTPVFSATAPLHVSVSFDDNPEAAVRTDSAAYARDTATSYAEAVATPAVLAAAAKELGLGGSAAALAGRVSAQSPEGTAVLIITATDPDPEFAAAIANAVAASFAQLAAEVLDPPAAGGASAVEINSLGPAIVPSTPDGPQNALVVAMAALMGLVAGAALLAFHATRADEARDTPAREAGGG